jgi:hypothetical protein
MPLGVAERNAQERNKWRAGPIVMLAYRCPSGRLGAFFDTTIIRGGRHGYRMGATMIRITTSLAAIFLLSQVTLAHTQVDGNKPEPLDDSSSDRLVAPDDPLGSLRTACRKIGTADKDKAKPWVHCRGEVATLLFRLLGNKSFGVEATEVKKRNGVRYLERWSKQNLVVCWEHLEETGGDPIAIVFYECGMPL